MHPDTKASSERVGRYATVAGFAVVGVAVFGAAIVTFGAFSGPWAGTGVAVAVTVAVAACGVALGAVIRLVAADPLPVGWIRRSSVGALLLTPAGVVMTQRFVAAGWDFDTCGTLLDPNRPGASDLADFRSACDAAAGGRWWYAATLAAVGCVMAIGYGLWLRRLARRAHGTPPAGRIRQVR